jgi:protein SCO1/2
MMGQAFKRVVLPRLYDLRIAKLTGVCLSYFVLAWSVNGQSARPPDPVRDKAAIGSAECQQYSPRAGSTKASPDSLRAPIPDVIIVDQNGRKVRFYSDLVKGKVVVLNFVFTSCTVVCPLQGESFARLQGVLGDKLGRDVYLVSVSVDPEADTPERLRAWGASFGARTGWTLVTGSKPEIDAVVKAFTGDVAIKGDHSPVVFLINEDKGVWIRAYALGDAARWTQLIKEVTSGSQSNRADF